MTALSYSSRLVLGTVQLGQPYGIANKSGKPDQAEAQAIVHCAWEGGIRFFDTARSYGESEAVLGKALRALGAEREACVVSKLTPDGKHAGDMRQQLERSLAELCIPSLYACLLHREDDVPLLDGRLGEDVAACVRSGLTGKFGVSVYTTDAAWAALRHPLVSIVQLPAGVFDRRFEAAGIFDAAREKGIEIHIRSVLLQGLLCMAPEDLPDHLSLLATWLRQWRWLCASHGVEAASLAVAWTLRRYPDARILFGAEQPEQVRKNLVAPTLCEHMPAALWEELDAMAPPQQDALLNPALWHA